MTPYGIVYSDNVLSLNESRKQWLKKEKIISKGYFALGYLVIAALVVAGNIAVMFIRKDFDWQYYSFMLILELALSLFLVFLSVRKEKEISYNKNCFNKEKKQIVLGESSAVFTSPYRQTEYYYDEIEQVVETDNTITIFIESEHCYPVYVSKNTVEKGNADIFRVILMEKTDGRYIFAGGKAR